MSAVVQPTKPATERAIPNYRQQLKKALPAEVFKPDHKNLLWLPIQLAIIGACWYGISAYFQWWLAPILAIVAGHSMACMGFVAHDVGHGGTIKQLWLRDLLCGLGFSPLGIGPLLWRKWHNGEHHANTQVKGVDPDHLFTMEDYETKPILQFLYRIHPVARNLVIFGSFSFRMTQQTIRMMFSYFLDKETTFQEKAVILAQFVVPTALWAGGAYMVGGVTGLLWGYVFPLFVANTVVITYIATNHFLNPLDDERDCLATSLSVTLPRGFGWLDAMHGYFGAHVAHHLFPQASSKNARLIEKKVAELFPDRYHCMPLFTALKLLWNTPWVYEGHTQLVDPVREERHGTLGHGLKKD